MMNPASFQTMTGGGPAAAQGMQRNGQTEAVERIMEVLRAQPKPPGWQSRVSLQTRTQRILQLMTALRLVKTNMSFVTAIDVAMKFEINEFQHAPDQQTYEAKCREKLGHLKDARDRQAVSMQQQINAQNVQNPQMGLMQPQSSVQGSIQGKTGNQSQQNFPHHLQHQMQASPIPLQHQQSQMTSSMESQTVQAPAQQRQAFPSSVQPPGQPRAPNQESLTPKELMEIHQLAQKMAKGTRPEEMQRIRASFSNLSAEHRQMMARQNMDPVTWYFRSQAMRQFRERKAHAQAQFGAAQQNQPMAGIAGATPGQQMQVSQNAMIGQQSGGAPGNGFDNWTGNVENFIDQQANALRASEEGQLVVPASNSQRTAQQQLGGIPTTVTPAQSGQPRSALPPTNTPMTQQQLYSVQQAQQEKMHQAAQIQAQSQVQARANATKAQQIALQGQPGGMTPHLGQRPPHQSPPMSMLNRPLGPSGKQPSNQGTPQQSSRQGTLQVGQQHGQPPDARLSQQMQQLRGPGSQAESAGQRPNAQIQLPEALRQQLLRLPPEQRAQYFNNWQRQRNAQAQQQAAQNLTQQGMPAIPMVAQPQVPHPGQPVHQQPIQFAPTMSNQAIGASNPNFTQRPPSTQQLLMNGVSDQHQSQPTPQQRAQQPRQTQQQQQQQSFRQLQQQRQQEQRQQAQHAMQYMTPERVAEMDKKDFPKNLLNAQNPMSQPPDDVKTWGQLKAWVEQNPQQMQHGRLEQLKNLQSLHWTTSIQNPQQRQQLGLPPQVPPVTAPPSQIVGQAPPAEMVPQGVLAQVGTIAQPPQGQPFKPQQLPSSLQLAPVTDQDVQNARHHLPPQARHWSDAQIKSVIMQQRQKKAATAIMNARNSQQPQPNSQQAAQIAHMQNGHFQQTQPMQPQRQANQGVQGLVANRQQQPQIQQQRPVQQAPSTPDTQIGKAQAGGKGARQGQQSRGQPPPQPATQLRKGTKRPSGEDVIEVPDPSIQQAQQISSDSGQPFKSDDNQQRVANVQPIQHQTAVMTPNQRAQLQQKQDRAQALIPVFNSAQPQSQQQQHHQQQAANPAIGPRTVAGPNQIDLDRRLVRYQELVQEVARTNPKRQPVPMDAKEREAMCNIIRDDRNLDIVKRLEGSICFLFKITGEEAMARDLISSSLTLNSQYKDKEYNPADIFTMSRSDFDSTLRKMQHFIITTMNNAKKWKSHLLSQARPTTVQQEQLQPPMTEAQGTQAAASRPSQGAMHPLNAENLHTQQEALQAARRTPMQGLNSRDQHAPAAPTSARPPFSLGASSPHGVPQMYGPNEMTQDKLKIPPPKKRKPNQQGSAASTPANALGTPGSVASPQIGKLESPNPKRQPAQEATKPVSITPPTFRCSVAECEFNSKGFACQADLLKHKTEAHEAMEPLIEDPLQFAQEAVAEALGLNKDGSRKTPPKDGPQPASILPPNPAPQKMQRSPSKLGQMLKQDSNSSAPGFGTPMARPPTSTGAKTDSPASNLLKTPQTTNVKTPGSGSSGMKSVLGRCSNQAIDSSTPRNASDQRSNPPASSWADSSISPSDLMQCFQDLDGLSSLGAFSNLQPLTPALTPPSDGSKHGSSRSSDISENDELMINISGSGAESWNPFDTYDGGLSGDMEAFGINEEEIMDLSWENDEENNTAAAGNSGRGVRGQEDVWGKQKGGWDPNLFCLEY